MSSSRIMKSHEADDDASRISRFNYNDLVDRCDNYMDTIRQQARQMLLDAHAEAEVLKKTAYEAAHQQGYTAGLNAAEKDVTSRVDTQSKMMVDSQLKSLLPASNALAEELQLALQQNMLYWEQTVIEMAIGISEKILQTELRLNPMLAIENVRQALQLAVGETGVTIRMHPDDMELMQQGLSEVLERLRASGKVETITDATLSRGGCIVVSSQGRIDARIETQLARIAEELIDREETT